MKQKYKKVELKNLTFLDLIRNRDILLTMEKTKSYILGSLYLFTFFFGSYTKVVMVYNHIVSCHLLLGHTK